MRSPALALLLIAPATLVPLHANQAFLREAAETNVNQRYTIETILIGGQGLERAGLPATLRRQFSSLIGSRCDVAVLDDLAEQLRRELHLRAATQRLLRGSQPDRIRVNFDIVRKEGNFEVSVPKFLYHSSQDWTGELDATIKRRGNSLTVGGVSNGDDLTERFAGFSARYDNAQLFDGRLRLGLGFENYEDHWAQSTRNAALAEPGLDLYASRRNVSPEATLSLTRDLSVSAGLSFQTMQPQNPLAWTRAANAFTAGARWGRRTEGVFRQMVDLRYSLRAGFRALGSDYGYSRHAVSARYEVKSGRHTVADEFQAGTLSGTAPLYERFVLGSSSTLRGWNRYAVDPLGGARLVHNSLSWGYQVGDGTVETFYDSGALWSQATQPKLRHSVGAGYRQGIFVLTVAFPVVKGHMTPVFMAGMNY